MSFLQKEEKVDKDNQRPIKFTQVSRKNLMQIVLIFMHQEKQLYVSVTCVTLNFEKALGSTTEAKQNSKQSNPNIQ